jgi:hypothetical protein
MRENRMSGSMRGCRKRATSRRACALLYQSPHTNSARFSYRFTSSVPLIRSFRSFVGHMSPPSLSARAYSAGRVSQSLFSLVGLAA